MLCCHIQIYANLSRQTKVHFVGKKPGITSDNPPPQGYICYRCGEKGHWIKECPTNDDPNYENKPRIKRTTGIPRSFLKTVDKPVVTGDGGDDAKPPSGIMVNAEGQFVIAEPDKASWEKFQEKTRPKYVLARKLLSVLPANYIGLLPDASIINFNATTFHFLRFLPFNNVMNMQWIFISYNSLEFFLLATWREQGCGQ